MEKPPFAAFNSIKSLPVSYRYDGQQSLETEFQGDVVARNGKAAVSGTPVSIGTSGAEREHIDSIGDTDDSPYSKVEPIDEEGLSTEEEDSGIDGYTPDPLLPTRIESKWEDTSAYSAKKVTICLLVNWYHSKFRE